jgi:hypothetical protein
VTKAAVDVRLGYELGSGREILIPIRHMAVTGQTQEAGKTTALEALVSRSGMQAVTFITKRGEGSFVGARRIAPYFREQADWQFVASVLEASRGEKLKFERAWIIRASKGARTLGDVHRNVREAMKTAKGMSADVYLTLDAYLDVVVPSIGRVQWARTLDLQPGVNAVDLTGVPPEMQHLVIKSCLDWVLERAERTIVVIPEAWKFIPEARNTPVKLSALALIRQGAALKNYVWLDSQDLGGVDKEILRSVPVWLLGVQREANEIKRTLSNIPDGIAKPKKSDLATLELGIFYACWGRHVALTYVQPVWMSSEDAKAVVTGEGFREAIHRALDEHKCPLKENAVTDTEARQLREENAQLRELTNNLQARVDELLLQIKPQSATSAPVIVDEFHEHADRGFVERLSTSPARGHLVSSGELLQGALESDYAERAPVDRQRREREVARAAAGEPFSPDEETRYQVFKTRLLKEATRDPQLLRVLSSVPELEVVVKREVVTVDGTSGAGWIGRLILDRFFDEPTTGYSVFIELKRRGAKLTKNSAYNWCDAMVERGFLTKEGSEGYQVVTGMKVNLKAAS